MAQRQRAIESLQLMGIPATGAGKSATRGHGSRTRCCYGSNANANNLPLGSRRLDGLLGAGDSLQADGQLGDVCRDAMAAWKRFVSCVSALATEEASTLWKRCRPRQQKEKAPAVNRGVVQRNALESGGAFTSITLNRWFRHVHLPT